MPDLTDTTFDVHTFTVAGGSWWLNSYQQGQRDEADRAAAFFMARTVRPGESTASPAEGTYRYVIDRGIFCPLGRVRGPLEASLQASIDAAADDGWRGRDDMGDIQIGERITCQRADGTTVTGDAHHTSWGDWYTLGGLLLVPASDDIRWRRA